MQSSPTVVRLRAVATPPAPDVPSLLESVRRKDAALARAVRNVSIANICAISLLVMQTRFALQQSALSEVQPYVVVALAAFLIGSVLTAIVFSMRPSGVVLELVGSQFAFKLSIPVISSIMVGIGALVTGLVFFYEGMRVLPSVPF